MFASLLLCPILYEVIK